jgi:GntR family transcriptional repressor for pyruvate dehydrogenase complex
MLEPIKAEKLYNVIVRRISAFINEQKLKSGDRLPSERELAVALSVSRASVRQAIAVLSAQGILVMRQGDGTFVANYINNEQSLEIFSRYLARSQLDPDDILEARLLIECEAARLCTARANKEQITKIQNILGRKDNTGRKKRKISI